MKQRITVYRQYGYSLLLYNIRRLYRNGLQKIDFLQVACQLLICRKSFSCRLFVNFLGEEQHSSHRGACFSSPMNGIMPVIAAASHLLERALFCIMQIMYCLPEITSFFRNACIIGCKNRILTLYKMQSDKMTEQV